MKRHYKIILIVAVLSIGLWSFIPKSKTSDPEKDKALLELLTFVIERGHYKPSSIDDAFSKGVYKDYIAALDPSKRFFLQSDIYEFAKYETKIDDAITNKDLTFFDLTYNRLMKRMEESKSYYKAALENSLDYKKNEEINTDYEKMPYATDVAGLKERWRKQVKLSALASLVDKQRLQDDIAKNAGKSQEERLADYKLKIGEKFSPELEKKFLESLDKEKNEKRKTYDELEVSTRESTLKSLNEYFEVIKDLDREDWFSVYLNAIATRFDPHTSYFPADEKERFDVSMSGNLKELVLDYKRKMILQRLPN